MIKLFNRYIKELQIQNACKKYNIENYTINSDGSIDVDGSDVSLFNKGLTKLPLKFNRISGFFDCSNNKLTSLEGCPNYVGDFFDCSNNKLTSLEGSPDRVIGSFVCSKNKLISLKGLPIIIENNFISSNNPISIIDSSVEVKGEIYLYNTNFDDKIKELSQEKLRILFEHGVDYDIFDKNGTFRVNRLERLFKDFGV